MDDSLILKDEVYRLVGAAMETYNELGHGYQEGVYQEAYERELVSRGIPFSAQKPLVIYYKGEPLQKSYVADLVAFDAVIVELKALERLTGREEAQ
jgi:GxxExxY protein